MATQQFFHRQGIGRVLFVHKLSIYLTSIQETQLRLYYELERFISIFLSTVGTLSKGYLPAYYSPSNVQHYFQCITIGPGEKPQIMSSQ